MEIALKLVAMLLVVATVGYLTDCDIEKQIADIEKQVANGGGFNPEQFKWCGFPHYLVGVILLTCILLT